jgi:hypothetical protein
MSKHFAEIEPAHAAFIARQHMFFTASAAPGARINLSPKGLDGLRVLNARQVVYLDHTGSGNETAAHLAADGRLTLMVCAFEGAAMILRLYGRGRVLPRGGTEYRRLLTDAFADAEPPGARQMVLLEVDGVQTSCGFGVPLYDYGGERDSLTRWADHQGEAGLADYRAQKNRVSIDGLPTGFEEAPVRA